MQPDEHAAMALNYIKPWPRYNDFLKQVAQHEKDAHEIRKPIPHAYAVLPAMAQK